MKRLLGIIVIAVVIIGIVGTVMFLSKRTESAPIAQTQGIKEAEAAVQEGRLVEARVLYQKAMEEAKDPQQLEEIQKKIEEININIILSPAGDKYSTKYVVKPGDSLAKIAQQFHTTTQLIKRANNLKSDIIHPNQELKVNTATFTIVTDKSQNRLFLKVGEDIIKTYVVSTGKNNSSPVGTFTIVNKLTNPTWFKAGAVIPAESPENILGTRWLGFDLKGYGIHGTTEPQNLGQQVTLGCVRMKNQEVEELYDIVPEGTEVTIVD